MNQYKLHFFIWQGYCAIAWHFPFKIKKKDFNKRSKQLNKKPNKYEADKTFSLLIMKMTKIMITSLYNMTDDYIYIYIYI